MTMKQKHIALARECERLARQSEQNMLRPDLTDAERSHFSDQAKAYQQMRADWIESALYSEEARPSKFTGKAAGERKATLEKRTFLLAVAEEFGTRKHAAIAVQAVEKHPSRVRKLWRAEGKSAEAKILNFIKNNGL